MLRIKQIGTICFAISLLISAPLFATDIPSSASTADCKHTPLQVYSGTSNLEAGWQANTIQLHWYNGDTEIQNVPSASQSCVYDGTLTPPATIPTRTGYTFKGWRVRQAGAGQQVQQCSLSSLDATIEGIWELGMLHSPNSSGSTCSYWNSDTDVGSNDCSDSYFDGFSVGEWAIGFNYGTIKGISKCSTKEGNTNGRAYDNNSSNWTATDSEITSTQDGRYCWCKATNFMPNSGPSCVLSGSVWVLHPTDYDTTQACLANCGVSCSDYLLFYSDGFRAPFFSVQ